MLILNIGNLIIFIIKIQIYEISFNLQSSSCIRQDVLNQPADSISEPYKERFGQRVLIECQALNFRLQINSEENNDSINQVNCLVFIIYNISNYYIFVYIETLDFFLKNTF